MLEVGDKGHADPPRAPHRKNRRRNIKRQMKEEGCEGIEYQCPECSEVFESLLEVHVHQQQIHTASSTWHPQYECQTCGQTFFQKRGLNSHLMVQHGAPARYHCDHCDYVGPRLYHLKRHMKVHTGEKNHVCEVCNKGLKSLQAYRNHLVLHTNEGRYRCPHCQKAFNQRNLYEDHCRTHGAARCYSCRHCDATFKTYKNVACHVRAVHLGDKRFICDVCGAQHMTGANLREHLKTHPNAASLPHDYQCNLCDASFRGLRGLTAHLRMLHEVGGEGTGEVKRSAASHHPTRRPKLIDYAVLDEKGKEIQKENAVRTKTLRKNQSGLVQTDNHNLTKDANDATNQSEVKSDTNTIKTRETEGKETVHTPHSAQTRGDIMRVKIGSEEDSEEEEVEVEVEEIIHNIEASGDVEVGSFSEEEDRSTVLVESEDFVFRVRAEDIEFQL